ncbi:MAG TPA: hypothetical protein VJ835_00840 [Fimbriimonadaceae bacterium]|nr:hypothetical protein [Fimbriimonadaceae bacterium]
MARFWPTTGIVCLFLALALLAGRGILLAAQGSIIEVEGSWLGPWPLDGADDCRTRLFPNGQFDLECRQKTTYAGKGIWTRDGNEIRFEFSFLAKNGESSREAPDISLRTDGSRNVLFVGLSHERGEPHKWTRAAP